MARRLGASRMEPSQGRLRRHWMKVIVDLCVVPIGVGVNLAPYIAACERVLLDAGLKIQLHPNGTAIEGEWAPVFSAIEACHAAVHAMGAPRIFTTVKLNTRTDRDQTLEDKVASVEALLLQQPERGQ
ncbi:MULTISPECIES: MTH1187 family thiamine-binding protein [Synechococcales]|uniref:MTH1187 family thiamine-binding protein n=1 Tax=unclassified Synechococcus TaxID=2626047 RepID=UPI0037D9F1D0